MAYFPPTGSVVAFQSNPSVLQTLATIANTNVNVSGSVVAFGFPTNQNVSGSVVAFQGAGWSGSVAAIVVNTNLNVSGSVATWINSSSGSVITIPQGSIAAAIISGSVAVATGNSSVQVLNFPTNQNVSGSVVAFQGTSPWVVNFQNSSILATPVGSTITVVQANSIVGTYAEDSGHTTADKGLFVLGVRNDTVSSLTSADLDYTPHATDSQGRTVIKPFSPNESEFTYTGSVVSTSVTLIQASAVGKRSYITDFFFANTGASTTLVTIQDGSTSVLGYTIVPTTGGSNSPGIAIPLKTAPSQDLAFKSNTATSVLYITIKGYQAP